MSKRFRFLLILVVFAAGGWMIWPTLNWYFFLPQTTRELSSASRDYIRDQTRTQAREWIATLRTSVLADPQAALPKELEFLIPVAQENYKLLGQSLPEKWNITTVSRGFRGDGEFATAIENKLREDILAVKDVTGIINLGLDLSGGLSLVIEADWAKLEESLGKTLTPEGREEAVQRSLEVLRNRVDSFGVTEPQIKREPSGNRIFLDLPGDGARQQAEALLRSQGSLSFNIVNDEVVTALQTKYGDRFKSEGFTVDDPLDLPEGTKLIGLYEKDRYGLDRFKQNLVIKTDPANSMEGRYIVDAMVDRDQTTLEPTVNFTLNSDGATLFFQLTQANTGKTMAVVMDGKAKAGARISEAIPGGQVRVTGFDREAANTLKTILRSGSLPVDLTIKSAREIGASLGAETVTNGINAMVWGFAAVLVFMLLYYKAAGLNANLALILNMFLLLSLLAAFGLTLTMTSIAGLVLTAGMAVDANVIIYERIKEEWFAGKTPAMAVKAGFDRAFWTIFDSNITTLIASLSLSLLGNGPVQGFGVTLSTGIITSMFTAIFVNRFFFDFRLDHFKPKGLSIAWRKPA